MNDGSRFLLMVISISLAIVHSAAAQDTGNFKQLSFEEALLLTRENSHTLKQSAYLHKEKEQEVRAAKGLYLPKVGIAASYMAMSDDLTLDLTPVRDAITPLYSALSNYGNFSGIPNPDPNTNQQMPILPDDISTQIMRQKLKEGLVTVQDGEWNKMIQEKQLGTVMANLQWPIYAGGKIHAANEVAEIQLTEADQKSHQKEDELMSELVERYYGLCLAQQAILVRLEVYDGMEKHLQDAIKMQKEGLIANADVLHAQVFHSQAERELSKAKRTEQILNQALLNTIATDDNFNVQTNSELFYLDSIEDLSWFQMQAREQNPLLQQVESKRLLAEQGYKAEKAEYFPAIAAQGVYDIVNKDLSPYAPEWTVGIGLKWTLFDGTARYRKVTAAACKTDQVREAGFKAQKDIETMINKSYQELNMYREQLDQLASAKEFAEEYVRVTEKAFHEEMANSTEVIDARLALCQVRIERLQAIYGYDLSLAHILEYSGIADQFPLYARRSGVKTESYQK
jgi:outer membrane protein TolC